MIDPMLRALNQVCPTLALADDLVGVCHGEVELNKFLTVLKQQCTERLFEVNKKKSAIVEVRLDGRQSSRTGEYLGYPFQESYKYLGVVFDSCLNFKEELSIRQSKFKQLNRQLWPLKQHSISGKAKLQVWHSLHRSKWSYAAEVLMGANEKFRKWLKSKWYDAARTLLGIKSLVETNKLFQTSLGLPWECYLGLRHKKVLSRLTIDWPSLYCDCRSHSHHELPLHSPIEQCLRFGTTNILKLRNKSLVNGWTKEHVEENHGNRVKVKLKSKKVLCTCDNGQHLLNLEHFLHCETHKRFRTSLGECLDYHPTYIVHQAKTVDFTSRRELTHWSRKLKALTKQIAVSFFAPAVPQEETEEPAQNIVSI